MPTTRTLATGPVAALVAELTDLLKLAKAAARLQLEKAAPEGWTMPDEGGVIWPRFKNEKEFYRAKKAIDDMPERLGKEVEALVGLVRTVADDLSAFTIEGDVSDEELRARAHAMNAPWRCRQFTVQRRAIDVRLRMLHALIAELYCCLEQIFSNVELIYVCPPHPCEDPAIAPDDIRLTGAFSSSGAFQQAYRRDEAAAEAAEEEEEEGAAPQRRRSSRRTSD